jgi:hypothetical protein
MMSWKGFKRKRLWPNKVCTKIRLEEQRKTTKNFSQESRYQGQDLKPGVLSPKHVAGALTT